MMVSSKPPAALLETAEGRRIGAGEHPNEWRTWGPYLSERQWGTVREDYSPTATPGNICRTTMPEAAPTAGARTASQASGTITCAGACRWHCGTDKIRS